jgi:hypothetical protein
VPKAVTREASPAAAIIDSQTVKSAEKGGLGFWGEAPREHH